MHLVQGDGCPYTVNDPISNLRDQEWLEKRRQSRLRSSSGQWCAGVVKGFDPDRIILFGSHARGEGGPDSDVDLLIVLPVEGSKFDKCLEIRAALGNCSAPLDIIVSRPEEFAWRGS